MIEVSQMTTVEARNRFSDFVNQVSVRKKWIVLTRRSKPVAGAVPLEDFQYFEGPERSLSPQGMKTFEDIMDKKIVAQTSRIAESQVPYEARATDNRIRRVTSAEARDNLSDVLNRVCYGKERIILTRRHWELLALVPPEVFERYLLIDEIEDEIDGRLVDEALRRVEVEGAIPLDEILTRYGIE